MACHQKQPCMVSTHDNPGRQTVGHHRLQFMVAKFGTCWKADISCFEYIYQQQAEQKNVRLKNDNCTVDQIYLTEQILDVRCTVGILIIIEVIHYPIVFCHQLLVSGIVTAAEVFIHLTELKFLLRLKGRFKIQTLRVHERRCDPKRQPIKQNKRRLTSTAENIAKVPHNAQILAPNFRYMEVKVM